MKKLEFFTRSRQKFLPIARNRDRQDLHSTYAHTDAGASGPRLPSQAHHGSDAMTRSMFLLPAVLVLAGWAIAGHADAVTSTRSWLSHGPGHCQGALPNFEGAIRKRPQALANEGTTTAFVTCDFDSIDNFESGMDTVIVAFRNRSETPVIVSCTLVDGIYSQPTATFFPKSEIAPALSGPESGLVLIQFNAVDDNAGDNFAVPALSCQVPPDTEISAVLGQFEVEVGE